MDKAEENAAVREMIERALVYMTECTLATVETLAMRKKPPTGEYRRQISIATHGLRTIARCNIEVNSSRFREILGRGISVQQWADEIHQKYGPQK